MPQCKYCGGKTKTNYPFGRSNKPKRNVRRGAVKRNRGGVTVMRHKPWCPTLKQ